MIRSLITAHDVPGDRHVFGRVPDEEFAFGDARIARAVTSLVHRLS
jgi:hypothetical protein